jgi:DNA-binding response OmpR family regulator
MMVGRLVTGREPGTGRASRPSPPFVASGSRLGVPCLPKNTVRTGARPPLASPGPSGIASTAEEAVKILLVDDSQRLRRSLGQGLRKLGYAVDLAGDGEEGLALAETYDYHVIVLDLMLPGLSGLEVLRRLRARGNGVHILILSARDRVDDRVKGLQLGADDYLVKPFAFDELCARIQALVRRRHQVKNPIIQLGSLEVDAARRQVTRHGDVLHLTPSEYALLEFLAYHRGRVFSQEQLVEHLYRSDSEVSSNVVEVLVSGLRKKIHAPGESPILRTRRGFGYFVE